MSKLLKTRRGHDSEDEYSDAGTDYSTEIDDESIHSISDVDQSDFDYEDDINDSEDSIDESDENGDEGESDGEDSEEEESNEQTAQQQSETSKENVIQEVVHSDSSVKNAEKATTSTPVQVEEIDYEATKEKRIQEHREYRRKLAEDPSFVPYVGLFWSHDDRYRDDAFSETRAAAAAAASGSNNAEVHFNPSLKNNGATDRSMDPLMYKKWDHSGYEELLRLEEREERMKRAAIENGEEYENNSDYNKYHHRNRGNYNGRGGYQRYHNFNSHHRNRNYQQHRQPKTAEEDWPALSNKNKTAAETPIMVENVAWATATPDILQSHDNGPPTDILVDVKITEQETSMPQSNKELEKVADISIVNAWGSISRVEESETLNESSSDIGWGAETKTPASDDLGRSDSGIAGWGAEITQPTGEGWGQSPATNNKKEDSSTVANDWKSDEATNGWTNSFATNDNKSKQQSASSGWTEVETTKESPTEYSENKTKEQVPDQFMDAESQIGSPVLTTTEKTAIPIEEKASNSWAEMSANAEPEKVYSNNNYKRPPRNTFSPNERPYNFRGGSNFEENKRGYRNYSDRGFNKHQYNSRSQGNQQQQKEDNWDSAANSREWSKIEPPTQPEASTDSWGTVEKNTTAENGGWGEVSSEVVDKSSQWNTSTEDEPSAGWSTKPSNESNNSGWSEAPIAVENAASGWGSSSPAEKSTPVEVISPPESENNGWNMPSTSPAQAASSEKISSPLSGTENSVSGWDESPAPTKSGWGTSSVPVDSSGSGWGSPSTPAEAISGSNTPPVDTEASSSRWGQSNEQLSKQRQNGWNMSQSNSSTNWNADKKARMNKQVKDQPRKGRGYLSQKMDTTPPIDETPVTVTEEYPNHGDSDSDVEIILEADEEPDWVKNEQILGMTAPGEEQIPPPPVMEESPKAREIYARSYENSSPQPELSYRNSGKGYNQQRKPRRNFDENWRQRDDVSSDNENRATNSVPMYYPQPHHHINTGNITYVPMIPNGRNGSPMYAMPFPMGMPSSSPIAGSTSPNNSVGGSDSSPHINNSNIKFYSPMIQGPNGLQLPPGYEANGMVYYGMDPSSMYGAPQPFYYYGPPVPGNGPPMFPPQHRLSPNDLQNDDDPVEDGWGPPPDVDGSEEQWNNNRKPSPSATGNYHNSSAYYVYRH